MGFLSRQSTESMSEQEKRRTRIVSVIAATIIALACGTNVIRPSVLLPDES